MIRKTVPAGKQLRVPGGTVEAFRLPDHVFTMPDLISAVNSKNANNEIFSRG